MIADTLDCGESQKPLAARNRVWHDSPMGKRSNFPRLAKDKYATTRPALVPLLPYLEPGTVFAEPCAGDGALIDLMADYGHTCAWATDIAPRRDDIGTLNALALPRIGVRNIPARVVVTNPPWTRSILHPIIDALSAMMPCFFLFDADWPHTAQSAQLILRCSRIIPVGRIKWMPGSKHVGKDNVAWYEFLPGHVTGPLFLPRRVAPRSPPVRLMGPEERRRAQIKALGQVDDPGPLFEQGGLGNGPKAKLPLVQPDVHIRETAAPEPASVVGPLADPEVAGRQANGSGVRPVQQGERRDDRAGVGVVPPAPSALLAKLRSGLHPMVHPRIEAGDIGE